MLFRSAVGLSTGLIYIPGTYTKTSEIVELAKIASSYHGLYASHMRDEGDSVVFAINEALTIGREAKIPVEISHFKLSGQQNWGRSKETVPMIEKARKEGIEVTIDQYPYTASSTSISTLILRLAVYIAFAVLSFECSCGVCFQILRLISQRTVGMVRES